MRISVRLMAGLCSSVPNPAPRRHYGTTDMEPFRPYSAKPKKAPPQRLERALDSVVTPSPESGGFEPPEDLRPRLIISQLP